MTTTSQQQIDLLYNMVKTSSLSGSEKDIALLLKQEVKKLGYETEIDAAGNFVGKIGKGNKQIILLGHMDTVPGGPPVRIEDDILYGRGSVDAKGPLATFMMAVHSLCQTDIWKSDLQHQWNIIIIGAVEEEAESSKGAHFIKEKYRPDYCIIGEPSDWQGVTLGYKGRLRLTYEHAEDTTHSAGPDIGVADHATEYWNAIKKFTATYNENKKKIFEQLQSRIDEIHTSYIDQQNIVKAKFGFRIPPNLPIETLKDELSKLSNHKKIFFHGEELPFVSSRQTPFTPAFINAIEKNKGTAKFKHKTGTSDMNVVGPHWKCPIVAYGPGDSSLDHTPNEHIFISDYLKAIEVLKEVLIQVMSR